MQWQWLCQRQEQCHSSTVTMAMIRALPFLLDCQSCCHYCDSYWITWLHCNDNQNHNDNEITIILWLQVLLLYCLLLQYNDSAIVSAIAVVSIVLQWQQGESNAIHTTNNSYCHCWSDGSCCYRCCRCHCCCHRYQSRRSWRTKNIAVVILRRVS